MICRIWVLALVMQIASALFSKTFTHLRFSFFFSKPRGLTRYLVGRETKASWSSAETWLFRGGLIVWFMAGKKDLRNFLSQVRISSLMPVRNGRNFSGVDCEEDFSLRPSLFHSLTCQRDFKTVAIFTDQKCPMTRQKRRHVSPILSVKNVAENPGKMCFFSFSNGSIKWLIMRLFSLANGKFCSLNLGKEFDNPKHSLCTLKTGEQPLSPIRQMNRMKNGLDPKKQKENSGHISRFSEMKAAPS